MFRASRAALCRAAALSALVSPVGVASAQPDVQATARPAVTPRFALSDPSLSPDGREIAFVAGGDIWTAPAAGGVARLLVAHPATESRPLFSPDGLRLAFVSTRTGGGDIYVLDLSSGQLARRTFDDGRDGLDAWSRDGKWLYFSSSSGDVSGTNDIWRLPATGGQPVQVAADRYASEYWAAPSPDGSALAITARGTVAGQWWRHGHSHIDESEIWTVRNPGSGAPVYERVGDAGGGKDAWPMWLPDGKTLFYMSDRNGEENLWRRTIGGSARAVTRFTRGRVLWPSMAYDGSAIVFERDFGIWRYDVARDEAAAVPITLRGVVAEASAERQTLSQGFRALAIAPDTRKAAFIARGELFVVGTREGGEAARLTESAETEDTPVWFPDSRRVVYASNRGNAWHLRLQDVATRTDRELTRGSGRDVAPRLSPDGKLVAYQRSGRELRVVSIDGADDRTLAESDFSEAPFVSTGAVAWAPDSRWLAFVKSDARGFSNVWVVPIDGGAPRQVSFGSDANVGNIQWSPDGAFLLYRTAMRTETPRIVRIDLKPRTPRFREEQFRDLFGPASPITPTTAPGQPAAPAPSVANGPARDSVRPAAAATPRRPVAVSIVFEGIRQRASMLPTQGLTVGDMAISPDGRTLVFTGAAAGQQQIYAWSLDELARETALRPITTSTGGKSELQWSPDSRELWYLEGGRIAALVVESRTARTVATTAEVDVNFAAEKYAIFRQATTYLARNFFDERMNGVNWPALAETIEPYVAGSRTPDDLRRTLSLMIGELNASHLGISGATPGAISIPVGRLGLRYDRAALERDGRLVISEVIAQSPAAVAGVQVGERVMAIDGVPVRAGLSIDSLLMGKVGRRVLLSVAPAAGGASREVALQPASLGTEKGLLYRQWVEDRRAYVAKVSGGRLGYVHMLDMGQPSLDQLYLDLDAENQGREGVVVDIRNNNGGFVNVYAIDVLSRRNYLNFTDRGSGAVTPARNSLGQRMLDRPTILVTNQQTLSDGEDFTEGYRSLGLGKVVGEPTAGWIIFTSNVTLLDGATSLRLPGTRVTDTKGQDMEMHPRPVDITVVRPIGEAYSGKDSQLDAAVQALLAGLPKKP